MGEGRVCRVKNDDGPAVVAALLEELLGLLEILLGRAGDRFERAAADKDTGAAVGVLGVADDRLEVVLLVRHVEWGLAGLLVVEGWVQRVGPDRSELALRIGGEDYETSV